MTDTEKEEAGDSIVAQLAESVSHFSKDEWNACAGDANPFVSHEFLTALEKSASVDSVSGWKSAPVVIRDDQGVLAAAMPSYLKGHSQGEYVFDHHWAQAFENAGGRYYPKLQIAAPFSPVPGPRLLLRDEKLALPLLKAAETLVVQNGLSSAHATFVEADQLPYFEQAGWLIRSDSQFHWENRDYADFDAFLAALSSRKRKAIRKERRKANETLEIFSVSGDQITEEHWDVFWEFYQDTGARKYGQPYLTRQAFSELSKSMSEKILLIFAVDEGRYIAGALNIIGADTLYGRYWGTIEDRPYLHFEICYYQAIEYAITHGMKRVEAGAQGAHKLARGYEPVATWSAHFIADPGFRQAIADFLEREREAVAQDIDFLASMGPFKRSG